MSRTLRAEELSDWLATERARIANAFREVEQVQVEYQGAYTRFKAEHDTTLLALVDQVEAQADALDAALRGPVDARVPIEREAIVKRIADLDQNEIPPLQKQCDNLVQHAQAETATLRQMNPKLNDREEGLKQELATWQKQLDGLNAQVRTLSKGLGFITHAWQVHALDRERFRVAGRLDALTEELNKVRGQWQELHATADKEQAALKAQWQTAMVQLGKLEQERDYLAQDTDGVAKHRAILFVLDTLKTPTPVAQPALNAGLQHMIELNCATDDFETALGSIAGILGIAKGVDEGLARLGESVKALIDEQARHRDYLKPLRLQLPDNVLTFGAAWDDLAAKSQDEKKRADHPANFVAAMKPFLDERLTQEHITGFFNGLGAAIQQATRDWR
jgi:hypothetical protein